MAGGGNSRDESDLRALGHPLRMAVLEALIARPEQEASPASLAGELDKPLGTVAYHVRQLADGGLIREVRTQPVRGALEHFYRPAPGAHHVVVAARGLNDAIAALET